MVMVVRGRANVPLGVGAPSEAALAPSRRDLIGRTGPVSMEWGYASLEGPVAMEWGRSGGEEGGGAVVGVMVGRGRRKGARILSARNPR